eukprot:1151728-Pelagomonas_calceolata.AAC.1
MPSMGGSQWETLSLMRAAERQAYIFLSFFDATRCAGKILQHNSKKGPRGHDRHVHDMLRTSILSIHCYGCIVMFQERCITLLEALKTVFTRLQIPYQRPSAIRHPDRSGLRMARLMDGPRTPPFKIYKDKAFSQEVLACS